MLSIIVRICSRLTYLVSIMSIFTFETLLKQLVKHIFGTIQYFWRILSDMYTTFSKVWGRCNILIFFIIIFFYEIKTFIQQGH